MKKSQKALIILVVIGTIITLGIVVNIANTVEYKSMYSGQEAAEAGEALNKLIELGYDAKAGPGGSSILVAKDEIDDARAALAAEGYPKTGQIDIDIYKQATSFGMTDTDKKVYEKLQDQQFLQNAINKMDKVQSSTVLLNIVESGQFVLSGTDGSKSSAAVMLVLNPGQVLTNQEAEAIRLIVAKSVFDLSPSNITITDSNMNIYGGGSTDGSGVGAVSEQLNLQDRINDQFKQQLLNLLTPIFGVGNISLNVNAVIDFDKANTESIVLTPPVDDAGNNGIAVSLKETEERITNAQGTEGGEPGQNNNGGGVPVYPEIDAAAGDSVYYNVTREVNQEVNQIIEQIDRAQGTIKDISATIIINGDAADLAAVLPDVKQQVVTAIGVPLDKQDNITVSAMPFQQNLDNEAALEEQRALEEKVAASQQTQQILQYVIIGAVILGIIILFVIMSKKRKKALAIETAAMQSELDREKQRVDLLADDEIDINNPVQAPSVKQNTVLEQIKAMITKNPESVAQLLRNWLNDDVRR